METEPLPPATRAALLALLDDESPAVRGPLLAHFARLGPAARELLQAAAAAPDRARAALAAWFLAELKFTDPIGDFRAFIRSLHYELETGALLLARTVTPALDAGACVAELDRLAARCRELIAAPASPREQCRVLNRVLFHEHGFRGNTEHYTDPRNSLLDHVLARRTGLPISLSTVYLLVAARLGLALEPVGLPGHFVVGCFGGDLPFFVDPFGGGAFLDPAQLFALLRAHDLAPRETDLMPTPVREVLARTCRNLAHHYAAAQDEPHARLFAGFVAEFDRAYEENSV